MSMCTICDKKCTTGLGLGDCICLLCNEKIHEECIKLCKQKCSLGRFKQLIIPPTYVEYFHEDGNNDDDIKKPQKIPRLYYKCYKIKTSCDIAPVVAFVNPLSGDTQGAKITSLLKRFLNPIQVADLSKEEPHQR
jgi:diacylglycerol kinase (ATP)